jgi:hypothetical protein
VFAGLHREEASRKASTYARWTTGSSQAPRGTDDFEGALGKGMPSATAEARPFLWDLLDPPESIIRRQRL